MPHPSPSHFMDPDCFIRFKEPIEAHPIPERFTFPFQYQPHPWCLQAAGELKAYLEKQPWEHQFGHETDASGVSYGKMFGVLVVMNAQEEIGYLAAFSGKLAGKYHLDQFVPPVFYLLDDAGFYQQGQEALIAMSRRLEALEQAPERHALAASLALETAAFERVLEQTKAGQKAAKLKRQAQRAQGETALSAEAFQLLEAQLNHESAREHFILKDLKKSWAQKLENIQSQLADYNTEIQTLKEARRTRSASLQQQIFEHYAFLNQAGETKSLADIFQTQADAMPPAGAGECAAPKLLQYAFKHQLKPLAMAEFWWGESPVGEVRKHGHFYPACRGKCEPILSHMLRGMALEDHPKWGSQEQDAGIETLYEDDFLLVINKPAELLSVPGKNEYDSVYARMRRLYPEATGPMIVHRLDMSTSGIMLIAKTADAYKILQSQFINRSVSKRYAALLDGLVAHDEGIIELPLRVDLDDRPRQMVCYEYGKSARTIWKVAERKNQVTRIQFFPLTGRTHQLRVHAAHQHGLNAPIIGDELYGTAGTRLHLHADRLEFTHPQTGQSMVIEAPAPF